MIKRCFGVQRGTSKPSEFCPQTKPQDIVSILDILHNDIFQDNLSKLFKFKTNWSGQGLFCLMDIVRLP